MRRTIHRVSEMVYNNVQDTKDDKYAVVPIPESIRHLFSSIRRQNKVLLVFKFTEKYNRTLYFTTSDKNIVKSLELFERRVRELEPNITPGEYSAIEELILTIISETGEEKVVGPNEIGKKIIKVNKYSQNRKGPLFESIILDGDPLFITLEENSKEEQIKSIPFIDENTRTLYPPFLEEYLHDPYEFPTFEDFKKVLDRASQETIFSLFRKVKNIVSKYIDQEKYIINIITVNIIFSYFQDRFNTLHYLGVFGSNGSGKSSIGEIIEALAYRAMNTTDPNAANIFRVVGSVEPSQFTLIMDEADRIDQNNELMSILKTGYHYTRFVTRINPNTGLPEKFFAYGSKIIIGEKPPGLNVARGVNDRILPIIAYVGNPTHDIKEVRNPTETGGIELQNLRNELEETRNILFGYRLLHFKDPIPNINSVEKGRDKELTKPCLQLFSNPATSDDKLVNDEVIFTLNKLLELKNSKKDLTFEIELIPILVRLMWMSKTQLITFGNLWDEIINNIQGYFDLKNPNEFLTVDFGMIYRSSLHQILERLGVRTKRRAKFVELIFSEPKLIKAANQFNISVQTNFDNDANNNSEGYEGYEGSNQIPLEISDPDIKDSESNQKEKTESEYETIDKLSISRDLIDNKLGENEKKVEGFAYNHSEPSQPSSNITLKNKIKEFIYRIGNTDVWACKKCAVRDDKWFMQIHPCKGLQ